MPLTVRKAAQLLGPPKVTITYTGTGAPPTRGSSRSSSTSDRGVVVGNQSAPIPVRLDGRKHTISRRLVPIASTAPAGARYTLQLVAGSAIWSQQRATGTLKASRIDVELPVADPRGLGPRGRRCSTLRSFRFGLAKSLRGKVLDGRVLLRGRRVARVRGAGKGGRVRFGRAAAGVQN